MCGCAEGGAPAEPSPPRSPPPGTGPRSPLTGSRVWVLGSPRRPPRRTRAVAGASSPAQGCSGGGAEAAGRPTDPRLQGPLALWPPLRVGTRGPPIPFQRWPISWAQTRSADPDLPARGPAPGVQSRCLPVFSARLPSFPPWRALCPLPPVSQENLSLDYPALTLCPEGGPERQHFEADR